MSTTSQGKKPRKIKHPSLTPQQRAQGLDLLVLMPPHGITKPQIIRLRHFTRDYILWSDIQQRLTHISLILREAVLRCADHNITLSTCIPSDIIDHCTILDQIAEL